MYQFNVYLVLNKLETDDFVKKYILPYSTSFVVNNYDDNRILISIWTEQDIYDYLYNITYQQQYCHIIKKYEIIELI